MREIAYTDWMKAKGWEEKIPIKKPTESEAALFEQLVSMACSPKPRRRRVPVAKRVGQASRLPVSESKRDACSTFLEDLQFMGQVSVLLNVEVIAPADSNLSSFVRSASSAHRSSATKLEASSTKTKTFVATANDIEHPIRNQLIRLTSDSPDLFAVLQEEGAV